MKKYLCFVLILALMFTMITPVGVSAAVHTDLFEYLYEKQVNPYMFSGTFQSFLSFEETGDRYVLRNAEEAEMVCEEIAVFLASYEVTEEEIKPYIDDFFTYFSDKEDLFNIIMSFVINTENVILPFTKQQAFVETVVGAVENIRNDFYSETVFLNYLSYISESYYENKSEMAIKLIDDRLIFLSDVADYMDFLETSDNSVASSAISTLTSIIDMINDGDVIERIDFADYLVLLGFVSLEMDDTAKDDDPLSTSKYNKLFSEYAKGIEGVAEFYNIEEIVEEYAPKIKEAATQFDKNSVISDAMTKATTIRIISSDVLNDDTLLYEVSDSQLLEFAAVCGKKVRSELIKKEISVSKNQNYSLIIEFDDSVSADGISLTFQLSAMEMLDESDISTIRIISGCGNFVLNIATFMEKGLVSGNSVKFEIKRGSAEELIPGLELYAQGNEVIKIGLYGDNECKERIPYGALHFEMSVAGSEGEYGENKIYSIASDGERNKVSRYSIVDSTVAFEIGDSRYFAKIDGELTKPNPEATPTPEPTKKPSYTGGGNSWVDEPEPEKTDKPDDNGNKEPQGDTNTQQTPAPTDKVDKVEIEFSDVSDSHWAKDYIKDLAGKGILNGIGNNLFAPDSNVTREQFAKIIAVAFNIVDNSAECEFADVDKDAWYSVYVASAYKKGIINGIGDNLFGTGQNISRQDMATMIVRAAKACGIKLGDKTTYAFNDDVHIAEYAYDAVKILVGTGAISGYEDNSFRPRNSSTRAQVAKIVSSILALSK